MNPKKSRRENAEAERRVAEASKSIRRKFMSLKIQQADMSDYLDKSFKPIVTPLKRLTAEKIKKETENTFESRAKKEEPSPDASMEEPANTCKYRSHGSEIEQNTGMVERELDGDTSMNASQEIFASEQSPSSSSLSQYLQRMVFGDEQMDRVYGVRYEGGEFMLGNSILKSINGKLQIGSIEYPDSPGLYKLIFLRRPPLAKEYTKDDLETYKRILMQTDAHMRDDRIRANRGSKYKTIISKLFPRSTSGRGLTTSLASRIPPPLMAVTDRRPNYIYWDDPNELVDRLRLLLSSKSAGHTGHNNEIMSIIEELREANIIY